MRINYNVSAMLANNALANNDSLLAQSLERLSSGLKINHAKDNPAGLAMAKRMNAQLRGLSAANEIANNGVSVISVADGALSEVSDMLQRMNELAVKAATGSMTDEDREMVQSEIAQLKEEITRVSNDTEFNGQKLLNGEFASKGYIVENTALDIKVNSYSTDVPPKEYTIDSLKVSKDELYKWIDYSRNIFLLIPVNCYNKSLSRRTTALSKYYCIDNGLRDAVLLPQSNDDGKKLENTVFLHLYENRTPVDTIFYYKEKQECDFVVQRGVEVNKLIQVSWDLSDSETRKREVDGLLEASSMTGCKDLTIITAEEEDSLQVNGLTIKIHPAWKWLLGREG